MVEAKINDFLNLGCPLGLILILIYSHFYIKRETSAGEKVGVGREKTREIRLERMLAFYKVPFIYRDTGITQLERVTGVPAFLDQV